MRAARRLFLAPVAGGGLRAAHYCGYCGYFSQGSKALAICCKAAASGSGRRTLA